MNSSLIRIKALITRHLLLTFRTLDRILNIVYWPLITLIIWGGNMLWMNQQNTAEPINAVFFAMILWQIVYRVALEVANSIKEEIASRNLINLFSAPTSLYEWIIAGCILGTANMVLIAAFGAIMLKLIFAINVFSLGILLPISLIALLISGLTMGFIICGIFITWGRAVTDFMHAIVWLAGCFSAIYYPMSIMPESLQHIAKLLPTTYSFELVRMMVKTGTLDASLLIKCVILNLVYFFLSICFFVYAFKQSKKQGLGRLE